VEIDDGSGDPNYSKWFQVEKFAGDPVQTVPQVSGEILPGHDIAHVLLESES